VDSGHQIVGGEGGGCILGYEKSKIIYCNKS